MSDTTENTNELDSYGVWVKNNNQEGETDDLNFAESLDLPDFEESDNIEDSDFSDMFKEDDTLNLDTASDDDTTLTDDELMNITAGDGIQIEETAAEENSDIDDISFDSLEENSVSDADLSGFDDITIDEPSSEVEEPEAEPETEVSAEEPAIEEMDLGDFGVESSDSSDGGEEEISLDDFMDSGFSDESVASGNNGFAADAVPSSEDSEEVSLDDFVDMSEFGMEEEAPKKEETIVDEKPLDMDISFDASADTIQTEENDTESLAEDEFEEEEFTASSEVAEEAPVETSSGDNIESEEVDLSDFGIDADAEETPVTQDVESAKSKDVIVDYDLSVGGDSNMNAAPVVNEIKNDAPVEEIAEVEEVAEIEEEPAKTSNVDNSLLQQIVADLSNLKEEINTLKNNLEEMKTAPAPAAEASGIISEEIAVDEPDFEDDSKEDTGFFSGDDGDDTIALSTDELSNILNTADFSENEETVEVAAEEEPVDDFAVEETPVEETPAEEPVVDETPDFDESNVEVGEEISEDAIGAISDEASDISFDFEEENLSEPNLDDIEIDEEALEDDLPEEIEISKDDDILVESSSSDFMDSVQDTTDEHEPEATLDANGLVEESVEDDTFSTVDNVFEEEAPVSEEIVVEETIEEPENEPAVEVEEPSLEDTIIEEEPVVEDEPVVVDEPVIEDETFVEEPVVETAAVAEDNAFIDNDFVSHEDDNNELTDSNIDYLTTEENKGDDSDDENSELKKDIKSVLLYMDQLLENLPEEKIVEFAKSDEFTTYKKLFSELGLS